MKAWGVRLVAIGALAVAFGTVRGDVIVLRSGAEIATTSWRYEGSLVVYESDAGTVGIPRSEVSRIVPRKEPPGIERPDAVESTARLEPAATRTTEIGETLRQAVEALEARDFERAAADFLSVMRDVPERSDARIGYAIAQIALDNDALALSAVMEGLVHAPDSPRLHELMGDLMNREERVGDALRSWKRSVALRDVARVREKIAKGERELAAGRHYGFSTTTHFTLRFDRDSVDPDLGYAVAEFLEEAYWELEDALDHAPTQPITVLLYPEKAFRDVTRSPDWVAGVYDGKIRVPLGGLRRLDPRAEALLRHELTHAVLHSKTRGNCPQWLHEGLAQRFEPRELTDAQRAGIVRRIGSSDPAEWEALGFDYPTALSIVLDLERRRGLGGIVRLLDRLAAGVAIDDALLDIYRIDYRRLCREWYRALQDEADPR